MLAQKNRITQWYLRELEVTQEMKREQKPKRDREGLQFKDSRQYRKKR
jgi:hypothetical protein